MDKKAKSEFLVQIISTNKIIRSVNLVSELKSQEINFQISEGVVPTENDFDSGILHSKLITNLICQRKISKTEVGCALAHKKAVKNFSQSEYPFTIIFEDDAEILNNIDFERLENYLNVDSPRIVNLGWIPGYAVTYPKSIQTNNHFLTVVMPPTCAFAYAMNRPAIGKLLNQEKITDLADWPIQTFNQVEYAIPDRQWARATQDVNQSLIGIRTNERSLQIRFTFMSKIRLIFSFIILLPISRLAGLKISFMQAFNRILLKDLIYNYGLAQINSDRSNQIDHDRVELSMKLFKILKFFRLNQL
jgi:Glycosyltransferase family 25 (LPS biosynthesis protein)